MEDRCLICGAIVPEGYQVCPTCSKSQNSKCRHTDEEYRTWLIGCFHKYGYDELIALICPMGEENMVKSVLEKMRNGV